MNLRLPEGMTAEKLLYIKGWMDVLDLAICTLADIYEGMGIITHEQAEKQKKMISDPSVQEDLLKWIAEIDPDLDAETDAEVLEGLIERYEFQQRFKESVREHEAGQTVTWVEPTACDACEGSGFEPDTGDARKCESCEGSGYE